MPSFLLLNYIEKRIHHPMASYMIREQSTFCIWKYNLILTSNHFIATTFKMRFERKGQRTKPKSCYLLTGFRINLQEWARKQMCRYLIRIHVREIWQQGVRIVIMFSCFICFAIGSYWLTKWDMVSACMYTDIFIDGMIWLLLLWAWTVVLKWNVIKVPRCV